MTELLAVDANKLNVLQQIGFRLNPSCETCAHSDLSADGWGYCGLHEYQHLKHSEETSFLSVHRMGSCAQWTLDENKIAALGLHAFIEFLIEPDAEGNVSS